MLILYNLFNKRTRTCSLVDVEIASFPAVVSEFYHLLNLVTKNTLMFISVNVSFLIEYFCNIFDIIEGGIRVFHDLSRFDAVTWDATAKVVKTRLTENPLYYYELTVRNPTTGKISLPVAIMISSDQSEPTMKHWMTCFRNDEKRIYGANKYLNLSKSTVIVQLYLLLQQWNFLTVKTY